MISIISLWSWFRIFEITRRVLIWYCRYLTWDSLSECIALLTPHADNCVTSYGLESSMWQKKSGWRIQLNIKIKPNLWNFWVNMCANATMVIPKNIRKKILFPNYHLLVKILQVSSENIWSLTSLKSPLEILLTSIYKVSKIRPKSELGSEQEYLKS